VILTIDAGNSRVKWGAYAHGAWLKQDAAQPEDITRLAARWRAFGTPASIVVSNVAGDALRAALEQQLLQLPVAAHWIKSSAAAHGVRNHYRNPAQLGVDRWMALIGARRLQAGPCVVALSGTALTVDALSADGDFLGGLIAPGLRAMMDTLAVTTAGVKISSGDYEVFPTETRHAVATAAIAAALGCIAHVRTQLAQAGHGEASVVLSGGAASVLAPHVAQPLVCVDNLVLEGLLTVAQDS
jgi:type III pantothenate kinase